MTPRPLAVLMVLLAVGCSNGSTLTAPPSTTVSPSTSTSTSVVATTAAPTTQQTTSTTAAPTTVATTLAASTTTAPEPIESQLQRLLDRYDAAATAILADPRVASDPSSPLVATYLALFPSNSTFASGTVDYWASEGAKGRFYRPGSDKPLLKSTLLKVTATSPTEVTAFVCTTQSMAVVDKDGTTIEAVGGINGGEIVAVQVNGIWLLRDLTQLPRGDCPKPSVSG